MLANEELQDPCLVILAEHHDHRDAMDNEEIANELDLHRLGDRHW